MVFDPADLIAPALHLGLGVLFGVACVYVGVRAFDRMTPRVDELAELKRGNVAVGVLLAAVVVSVAIVVRAGADGVAGSLLVGGPTVGAWARTAGLALLRLLVALLIAAGAMRLALWAFDQVTPGLDEEAELAAGNVAVALALGGALMAVSFVLAAPVERLVAALAL